jgi:ATP-dependent phosphoenolpyruvate carboxykinase
LHDNVTILEAGDTISQADFKEALDENCEHLSSGMDLFIEDVTLGSHQEHQMGVRIITEDPAMALIARTAFVSISSF